jgi:CHAT domain-containing protein
MSLRLLNCSRSLSLGLLSSGFILLSQALSYPVQANVGALERGQQSYQAGDFPAAIAQWQNAQSQYRQQGDWQNLVLSLNYIALAQQELNQWAAAQQSLDEAQRQLKAQANVPALLWAKLLNTQGQLWLNNGKAEGAIATWQQAENYYQQAKDTLGVVGVQINQAQALQNLGFHRRAKQQLDNLSQTLVTIPDRDIQIAGLQALGNAWQQAGNYEEAEKSLEKALELARQAGDRPKQSAILLTLGQLSSNREDPDTALDDLVEAESVTTNALERIQAKVRRMRLMVDYDRADEASKIAPEVHAEFGKLPTSRASLYSAINFAASVNRLPKVTPGLSPQQFNQFLAQTLANSRQAGDQQAEAYLLIQWSQQYARHQQWDDAAKLAARSLQLARQLNAADITSQAAWQLGQVQKQQQQRTAAIRSYGEAVQALQSLRGDLVATNVDMQFSFRESVEPVYRQLVDLLLSSPQPNQDELKQAREVLEALQLAELDNFFREACLDKVQQIDQIDTTATVVYPIILPDRLSVILSQAGQPLRYYSTPVSKGDVDQALTQLMTALSPVSDARERNQLSTKLYDWLIRPAEIDRAFQQTKTLVFVLDGKLRNIPMAALYDGKQYLIEKYAVTLSPGMQLLSSQALQNKKLNAIVGGISEPRNGFSALPAVAKEVENIGQIVATSPIINQAFTNSALSDRVQNDAANVVHLATHGQFSSRLEDTFLLTWDGRINVKELATLLKSREGDANKTINLLVLSACDTAAGDDRAVLGLAGLAVKSGARSTIASLWPVKDKAAAKLMAEFYSQIKQPGTTKAEALRQAQLELIKGGDFSHPFFWSAFVLVGNWQ